MTTINFENGYWGRVRLAEPQGQKCVQLYVHGTKKEKSVEIGHITVPVGKFMEFVELAAAVMDASCWFGTETEADETDSQTDSQTEETGT